MRETMTEEMDIPIPDYIDRFLSTVAEKTGRDKEVVALFFLSARCDTPFRRDTPARQTNAAATGCKVK